MEDEDNSSVNPHYHPNPDSLLFVDLFEWSDNHLPIPMSFDSDYRIPTPEFMAGWTWEPHPPAQRPAEPEQEERVTFLTSRGTRYIAQLVDPSETSANVTEVRRSPRHNIASRAPFPSRRPAWAMLATDFTTLPDIPVDVALWCPCCTQIRPTESFRMTTMNQAPVETCIDCRKGQTLVPEGWSICSGGNYNYRGCGRFLATNSFTGFLTHETFTGIFCHDCRAFGHRRARLEGRYIEEGR